MRIEFLLQCLDKLEASETRALTWGLVDVSSSLDEVFEAWQEDVSNELDTYPDELFEEMDILQGLLHRGLVVGVPGAQGERYRTRMAETVRLVVRLRQIFPQHRNGRAWMAAPNLVSDYRFVRRPRRYPRRDIDSNEMTSGISIGGPTGSTLPWLEELLRTRGPDFRGARFQKEAFERLLGAGVGATDGTVISAGTGSGKTLAFYLPALARVADLVARHPRTAFTKVLAVYPRNELLKDQFAEIYSEARALDSGLTERNLRVVSIGAYFGSTPINSKFIRWGLEFSGDWECPYFRCPMPGCGGEMIWLNQDRRAGLEVLSCARCGAVTGDGEIRLTRKSIEDRPPDILFTTTEMLNRRLGDGWSRHVFGVNAIHPPTMCLLDEIHTYTGTHGAMVAHLLRRWKSLVSGHVAYVGLSATLKDAPQFFADLTGVPVYRVNEVRPLAKNLESEGTEYMLVVKGDPVTRTALLSTTIQTTMIAGRCLDSRIGRNQRISNGIFGTKTFVFTDDIDVTNRLYFATLDAEGRGSDGNVDRRRYPNGGLSVIREPAEAMDRYHAGQDWRACLAFGHELGNSLGVGRTSSQDSGVDSEAEVIVATSSLEVGFNDPEVGAVIQHKAPREVAQFLQRKGRAGRSRAMRPWTFVVLSDYGRDRLAYQAYDSLFDPEVDLRVLPVSNRYVLRMQACYALIDFIGHRVNRTNRERVNVWSTLAAPSNSDSQHKARRLLAKEIETLLHDPRERARFRGHLKQTLGCDDKVLDQVLWYHPRPVFLGALPTARRRLETNWALNGKERGEPWRQDSPLPEFVPQSLFSDLELPEVTIVPPMGRRDRHETLPAMPVHRAIKEFAPGRVSRRYGIRHALSRHWVGPDQIIENPEQTMQVSSFCDFEDLGLTRYWDGQWRSIRTLRPHTYRIVEPPRGVNDTSNAHLSWIAEFSGQGEGVDLVIPQIGPWPTAFREITAFLHANHHQTKIRRTALRSSAEIKRRGEDPLRVNFEFVKDDESVGMGFAMWVDAVRVRLEMPNTLKSGAGDRMSPKWQSVRVAVYQRAAWEGVFLSTVPSPFARQWLAQICMAAVTCEAEISGSNLETASATVLRSSDASIPIADVLEVIFHSRNNFNEEGEEADEVETADRLREELQILLRDEEVLGDLYELCRYLWVDPDESWNHWLESSYRTTMCAAIKDAIQALCPDLETGDLIVDLAPTLSIGGLEFDAKPDWNEIWLSEPSPGGTGVLEEFVKRYSEDPMRFMRLVDSAVQPSEMEFVAEQFAELVQVLGERSDESLSKDVARLRDAESPADSEEALNAVRLHLERLGFTTFHGFMSAITNRLFRPGVRPELDENLARIVSRWSELENNLGIEIDANVVAYLLAREINIEDTIIEASDFLELGDLLQWRYRIIYGLLWPRGLLVRQKRLELYSPFSNFAPVDPLLVREALQLCKGKSLVLSRGKEIPGSEMLFQLGEQGEVTFEALQTDGDLLKQAIKFMVTNPVDTGDVLVYPRLRSIRRASGKIFVEVEVAEAIQ